MSDLSNFFRLRNWVRCFELFSNNTHSFYTFYDIVVTIIESELRKNRKVQGIVEIIKDMWEASVFSVREGAPELNNEKRLTSRENTQSIALHEYKTFLKHAKSDLYTVWTWASKKYFLTAVFAPSVTETSFWELNST